MSIFFKHCLKSVEVSRSGFYDYPSRQAHPTIDAEEIALLARVKAIAGTSRSS